MARSPRHPRVENREGAEIIPFEQKTITLGAFSRDRGTLGKAFAVSASLEQAGREVKLTREEWLKRYDTWLKKPR